MLVYWKSIKIFIYTPDRLTRNINELSLSHLKKTFHQYVYLLMPDVLKILY